MFTGFSTAVKQAFLQYGCLTCRTDVLHHCLACCKSHPCSLWPQACLNSRMWSTKRMLTSRPGGHPWLDHSFITLHNSIQIGFSTTSYVTFVKSSFFPYIHCYRVDSLFKWSKVKQTFWFVQLFVMKQWFLSGQTLQDMFCKTDPEKIIFY